jgi:hypothetical protein
MMTIIMLKPSKSVWQAIRTNGGIKERTTCKKAVPLSHSVAKWERKYSSYSFLTSALQRGEWSVSRLGRALAPGKVPPVPTG